MFGTRLRLLVAAACVSWFAAPSVAYVDLAPTLGRIIGESKTIVLAEVERCSRDHGAVILKKVRDLKGESSAEPIKHQLQRSDEPAVEWAILDWAAPGRRCVLFISDRAVLVCLGEGWYQVNRSEGDWWRIGARRPDLPVAYFGPLSRLASAIPLIVSGKSAVITTLPHGADQESASFDLALNRSNVPALVRVQRLRANLRMPGNAMGVGSNPAFVLGMGRARRDDVTSLREQLRSADALTRAESAADLGYVGPDANPASPDLVKLLGDASSEVRLAAAWALLRINPKETSALDVLAKGMAAANQDVRRQAARAVGLAGPGAASLVESLGVMLRDDDILMRRTALQAIANLGPAAANAQNAVAELLKAPETAADAADALGRMGPAARPVAKRIAKLLTSEIVAQRWAAVRALSQIGGADAAPAVTFMVAQLPRANEYDAYNMMIYFSLLGPVAKDALPAIARAPIRHPALRQTTAWAVNPGTDLPWLGPLGNADIVQYIMESYVRELGDHLRPVAQSLATNILAGKSGAVPPWAYKLMARFPDQTLPLLTPALTDKDKDYRERAVVTLGFMGKAAAPAKSPLTAALRVATDQREQRLLQWCLRELE